MANKNNKKKQQTGGLQEAKLSVEEKQAVKTEKLKQKEKAEKKGRPIWIVRVFIALFVRFPRWVARLTRETFGELKKVRWPTLAKTIAQTGVVLGVVIIFSLIIFAMDRGLGELYGLLIGGAAR
ncbi:MAG: preprotein translocase subunit SecE [Firmicutes bacterium]|nr:preprotein translocase subunit SecE [Bacillota bacterium]